MKALLRILAILALVSGSFPRPACAAPPAPLNVLYITVDDMNWDSVGAYGCKVDDITPHIDKLASQGMRFEYGHVTIAICQPTRAVWMTGRYPHRSGALGFNRINPGVPTLLEALHDGGYFTGIMAKVPHVVPSRGKAWDRVVDAKELKVGRSPELFHRHAVEFLRAAKASGKPFFLMANSQDPHRPFAGSAQEAAAAKPGPNRPGEDFPGVSRTYRPEEIAVPGFLPDLTDVRRELAEYFTSVHRADEIVGAVLAALDEAGLADNTLVMFVSDHGMPLPFAKTNCYYNSTRTPWIVRWPGVVAPNSWDRQHFISGIDYAPTILEAVGLPPLEGMDGRSFLPILKGGEQDGRDYVITHINSTAGRNEYPMRSVITKQYAYIWNGWSDGETVFHNESQSGLTMRAMRKASPDDPEIAERVKHFLYRVPEELYDYSTDSDATFNLMDQPGMKAHADRLKAILLQAMKDTNDPQLKAFKRVVR